MARALAAVAAAAEAPAADAGAVERALVAGRAALLGAALTIVVADLGDAGLRTRPAGVSRSPQLPPLLFTKQGHAAMHAF